MSNVVPRVYATGVLPPGSRVHVQNVRPETWNRSTFMNGICKVDLEPSKVDLKSSKGIDVVIDTSGGRHVTV